MFNLFRMDLRRLVRSRSFYITLLVTAVMVALVTLMAVTMSDPEFLDAMEAKGAEISAYDRQTGELIRNIDQLTFAHEIFSSGFLLLVTGICVAVFFSQDFTNGFIKNIGISGPNRKAYVLEKAAFIGLYSGTLTALAVGMALLAPVCMGLILRANTLVDILQYTFFLWLPHWAFGIMALFMVLLSRNSTLGIIVSLASALGLTAALSDVLPHLLHLSSPSPYFLCNIVQNQCLPQAYPAEIQMVVLCSAGWGLVYTVGSLLAMEKRDI